MPGPWSLDTRVLVRPGRTFQSLAAHGPSRPRPGLWLAARRPLFVLFVLACTGSLVATSVASLRLIAPLPVYWVFVPLIEILALAVVVRRRREGRALPQLIDTFFAGHAPWTLFLLFVAGVFAITSPASWWFLLTRPVLLGLLLVVCWSIYVDVCFFRHFCGAPLSRAIRDVALNRLIAWLLIIWIFAVPEPTPFGVFPEIAEAILEVMQ